MIRENVNQNVKYWKKRKKRNRRQKVFGLRSMRYVKDKLEVRE
jgi:hypothetical protein